MILLLALMAVQVAQPVETYACEAPGGHYDKIDLVGGSGYTDIRGVIIPKKSDRGTSEWATAAGVVFGTSKDKNRAGLQLWSLSGSKELEYGIRVPGPMSDTPNALGKLPFDKPVRFRVRLDKTGLMTVEVNDTLLNVKGFTTPPKEPVMMCSGGEFTFEQVTITAE